MRTDALSTSPSDPSCGAPTRPPILDDVVSVPGLPLLRIGDFVFDRTTGEVRPADAPSGVAAVRLPPQPAKLLALLASKNGTLVTREEIRELLWPDTHVGFEQSLGFCIRQIRSAFGDSAADPSYLETLPKRGYRIMQAVETMADEGTPITPRPRWPKPLLAALLVAAVAIAFGVSRIGRAPKTPTPIRLAVMPFELAAQGTGADDLARLSEWLVAELSAWHGRIDVVGPRSTARYSAFPFPDMTHLAADLEVDYVLNARFFERDGEQQLIVELIRLADGAHPWAAFFTDTSSWPAIAEEVRGHVLETLDLRP